MDYKTKKALYNFHKQDGILNYGLGKYPTSVSNASDILEVDLLHKVNFTEYRMFKVKVAFLELFELTEIEEYLKIMSE